MNQFLSNKIIAGIVAVALLVGVGVLVSSGDTSSTTRNAALVVATPCTKPGQVTKVSKQSVVCATTDAGSLWYATMKAKGKAQACKSPGAIREKSNIVWVCGVIKKKKLWQATQPLTALAVEGDLPSTTPATPDTPVVADNAVLAEPAVIDTAATQTLAPAVPAALSLETQPMGGVNAMALETQPVVQLRAKTGAPISTAGITITAVTDRTNVVPSGNTAVTDATGRATFKTLSLMGKMGDIALTFTAPRVALEGITSGNLDLAAGVATALVSDTSLGAVASGQQFNQFLKLHFQDSSGNIVAVSGRDVVVSSSKEGPYGLTTVATASDGYVLFKDLMLIELGKTTLTFTSGKLSTTSTVMVKPGDSQGLEITTEPSEVATNDKALARTPVVQLIDAEGNNVTTEGFAVKAKILGFPAGANERNTELANSDATTNKDGVATFTGLRIKGLIGAYTLGFEPAGGVAQQSAKPTELSAGDAKKLFQQRFTVVEPGSAAGTWSLTQSPVIGLGDISNNPVTTGGVTVTATVPGEKQTFSAVTDADGVATLSNMTLSGEKSGDRTIKYTAPAFSELSEQINLPPLTPAVQAWVLLTGKTTTSPDFTTTSPEFPLTPPTSNSLGAWTYTSDTPAIAEVTATGALKFKVAGTVTIRANQAANEKFTIATKNAILNIGLTTIDVNQALAYPIDYDTTSGSFAPSFKPDSNSTGTWNYTSSVPTIASVDRLTGTVTPKGVAGEVIITATQAATEKYAIVRSAKSLVIYYQAPVYPSDRNIGSDPFDPQTPPASKSTEPWTYTSLNTDIATVDRNTGRVTLKKVVGTVTIRATQLPPVPTQGFQKIQSEVTVDIPLIPVVVSPAWVLPNRYTDGSAYTTPIMTNSNGAWTYTSSNATIATVDRTSGRVTPNIAGTTTITATHLATSTYAAATITADLRIYKTYQVGDAGPGGGKVFYVAPITPTWGTYLEAAPTDYKVDGSRASVAWCGDRSDVITPAQREASLGIGTGKDNTDKILANCNDSAARVAADSYQGGKSDWFLPSRDELNELCKIYSNWRTDTTAYSASQNGCTGNTSPTGGFAAGPYWSSSESSLGNAWNQDFKLGHQTRYSKTNTFYVRPVRAFRATTATTSTTCALGGTCKVGDTGPGGGTVFYVAPVWPTWGRYLEVALADAQRTVNSDRLCQEYGVECDPAKNSLEPAKVNFFGGLNLWCDTKDGIGQGKANTKNLLDCLSGVSGSAKLPASLANKYSTTTAGAGEWFLPSKDELRELHTRRAAIGVFVANIYADFYWSSTTGRAQTLRGEVFAWQQDFYNGYQYNNPASTLAGYVRPVRAF